MSVQILDDVRKAVLNFDAKAAEDSTKKAVQAGVDPMKIADALTGAVKQVGDAFGSGELFLPDLVMAGDAMKSGMRIVEDEMKKKGTTRKTLGKVAVGTVAGDIHDIGKALVVILLSSAGFEAIDLGVDVSAQKFVEAVKTYKPHILAMSALLTTTSPEQKKVVNLLKSEGLRDKVKVMVGGGAITKEFAKEIGADGYGATAPEAVKEAKNLLNIQ